MERNYRSVLTRCRSPPVLIFGLAFKVQIQKSEEVKMYIRIINGDQKSEWMKHSRQNHMKLLTNSPENVEIRIRDFYPNSPDKKDTAIIPFEMFTVLARDFSLEKEAQRRCDERNLYSEPMTDDVPDEMNVEQLILDQEAKNQLNCMLMRLTPTQRSRVYAYYFRHLTFRQIADSEGVDEKAIRVSISLAIKKLKMIL